MDIQKKIKKIDKKMKTLKRLRRWCNNKMADLRAKKTILETQRGVW